MDQKSWNECRFPQDMIAALDGKAPSLRKARLFGCACCQPLWRLLTENGRRFLLVMERAADDQATAEEVAEALERFGVRRNSRVPGWNNAITAIRILPTIKSMNTGHSMNSLGFIARSAAEALAKRDPWPEVRERQAMILRDIVGNPFRPPPPAVSRDWLAWDNGLVPSLARAAYEEHTRETGELDPVRLAVLSDALEDAGCDEAELLLHLRGPGPHARGCWMVDLLLGKE